MLRLKDEGSINTASYSNGNAGSLVINARELIEVGRRSNISSSVDLNSPAVVAALNLPLQPRGNAGNVMINAPLVKVQDRGYITVSNTGLGNSGKVSITADQILLDRRAQITGGTVLGEGGNVILNAQALILRQGSRITATAGGFGNGGNITIDSLTLVGLENSDIVANASRGRGGNVAITAQSILGLQYRTALTPNNDITASSEFGMSGNVEVNTIGINPANALNSLPSEVADSSRQISDRCGNDKASSFIATGRGGIPQGPQKRGSARSWNDLRPPAPLSAPIATIDPTHPLIEASALHIDASGGIALVAAQPTSIQKVATCGVGEHISS